MSTARRASSGADEAFPIEELPAHLVDYLEDADSLLVTLGENPEFESLVTDALALARRRHRRGKAYPTTIIDPTVLLHEQRLRKTDDEVALMRRAADVTRDAHLAAMAVAVPGAYEYEVEAELRRVFRRGGSERVAYDPIVGSGPNATVLHYRQNRRRLEDGDLLLIDAGAELGYYAADVTRTFPVNGTYSEPQRALYDVVLAAQKAAVEAVRPGATVVSVHEAGLRVTVEGLVRLGLVEGPVDEAIAEERYKPFFMHRTSHWLGMDVHDVGRYFLDGEARPLEPGFVLTVEPGIYVGADADVDPKVARHRHPDRGRHPRHGERLREPHRRDPEGAGRGRDHPRGAGRAERRSGPVGLLVTRGGAGGRPRRPGRGGRTASAGSRRGRPAR